MTTASDDTIRFDATVMELVYEGRRTAVVVICPIVGYASLRAIPSERPFRIVVRADQWRLLAAAESPDTVALVAKSTIHVPGELRFLDYVSLVAGGPGDVSALLDDVLAKSAEDEK